MEKKVRVVVSFRLKDKVLDSMHIIEEFVKESRKAPGCLEQVLLADNDDHNQFFFFELWQDESFVNQHTSSDYFKKFAPFVARYFDNLEVSITSEVPI